MKFSDIYRQIISLRNSGQEVKEAEVGFATWQEILLLAREPKWITDGWVCGVHLFEGDVPEGKIWPK